MELSLGNCYYGHAQVLKRYAGLPPALPFPAAIQHGWVPSRPAVPPKFDLLSPLPHVWVWSDGAQEIFGKDGSKRPVAGGAPFVYLADEVWTGQRPNAVGTLAFPLHGTEHIDVVGDHGRYARQLASLSSRFQPVTVCLHPRDIEKGLGRPFQSRGLRLTTNGRRTDSRFLLNFLENCSNVRYTTSNAIATASLYCMYLGMPFFLLGPRMRLFNRTDPALPGGELGISEDLRDLESHFRLEDLDDLNSKRAFARRELGHPVKMTRPALRSTVIRLMLDPEYAVLFASWYINRLRREGCLL